MKKNILLILLILFVSNLSKAENNFFSEGLNFFEKKEFSKAKFKFEQDLVFNPKSELSYLYLAKIFKEEKKDDLTEVNLNSAILINPNNEEAIYELILLKIKKSDFSESKNLIESFSMICKSMCSKKNELNNLLQNSFKN